MEVRKKSTKNIRRKNPWRRRHRPQLFRSYKRLLTSDFRPNELLKDMGFDISPTNSSSNSTVSPATATIVDEKQYDLNSCLFHPCKLELFQALSNMEWYVKCPFSRECGVFAHRTMQNAYMSVLNRRVHDTYRKLDGTVMCECNCQASLKVSQSPLNPGRPFFTCRILSMGRCKIHQEKRRTVKTVQRIRQVLK